MNNMIDKAWDLIAPNWPLHSFIARNPLSGLEHLPFEQAILEGANFFQQADIPPHLHEINRQTIKWCQVFFDEEQARLSLPLKSKGLYTAWRQLVLFDDSLHQHDTNKISWLKALPTDAQQLIEQFPDEQLITLMLTSLPGWAGYVKNHAEYKNDYLALRLALHYLLSSSVKKNYDAQLVFCIDTRSEPLRRAIETQGNYETFGFAGFFGIPLQIKQYDNQNPVAACPALITPSITLEEKNKQNYFTRIFKKIYYDLKNNFTSPFALVETLGPFYGLWMLLKTIMPVGAVKLKNYLCAKPIQDIPITHIDFKDQCQWAQGLLKSIGLTKNFSPLVLLCGHGSNTQNNPYNSALDCGACAGHPGGINARLLAKIMNQQNVREYLKQHHIIIPEDTLFIAGQHDTTTGKVHIYSDKKLTLQNDLDHARKNKSSCKSSDWAQTRPEWGLARNCAFIAAPRTLTQYTNLEGRAFLHSYDWHQDKEGKILEVILTAPLIVAQWINSQYYFSTIDNIAYGSGNKITQNITGKTGIMQGNSSDLMYGLPFQSVFSSHNQAYHEPLRLSAFINAPKDLILSIIEKHETLKNLFKNRWVYFIAIDPIDHQTHYLS